ncbi:ubiquinone biosynthesis regulatory protein kinase UbiB [Sulfuriflexus mobilis]|uniref:ubiquinone biosynthesis regulatory protein kinase UbiB n=1 Tax=Sulfuriflexus mobilis TaxID=1811807 RepID=UPI000F8207FD|nr:ubiquinone biosynthesis regulatory protein kinase UbiB [Sulfuriflexus mobilis]
MFGPRQLLRLAHINFVLTRHGLDELVFATHLLRPLRFLYIFAPWTWFRRIRASRGERIRRTLEDLGPIFVKFGQILSTRRDLLPDDIADELAQLQDNVPAFPGAEARRIIEKALGESTDTLFTEFDETPLASASIAQVHTATLPGGKRVIVKVLRPGIEKVIRRDLSLLHTLARLAESYWADGRRLRPREVVSDYEHTILDELDLMREAANASQLRRNFSGSNKLYVPEVYWPLARRNVLVMERIHGTVVSDIATLRAKGIDLKELSERGVEIFFTQVFRHNFFHADMHPGNIFVEDSGRYIAVDFGIMGTLNPDDQRYLAENFLAFFNRDYARVAELHVESGWIPRTTRVDEFEAAIRSVCEPIFERPLKEISFGNLLLRLFQTARRFDMPIQPQLVLLQKTLLNIEGLGRQLYPDLDLWTTAKPFLERWMNEHVGWRGLAKSLRRNAPLMAEKLPELPLLLHEVLDKARDGKLEIEWKSEELVKLRQEMRQNNRRTVAGISGAALIIVAAILFQSNEPLVSYVSAGLGAAILLITWSK